MTIGTQISDMTPVTFDDMPDDAQIPWVTTTGTGGFSQLRNYRSPAAEAIRARVSYTDLAEDTGAALVGAEDGAGGSLFTTVQGLITRLMSSVGSALVGFLQFGTGAVGMPVQTVLRDLPVTPEQFGAVGNGTADDTAALQRAIDTGRSINLTQGKTYLLKLRLNLTASNVSVSGAGIIKIAADFDIDADPGDGGPVMRALFATGSNCSFADFTIDCTDFVLPDPDTTGRTHACAWVAADGVTFRGVRFLGLPKGAAIVGTSFATWLNVGGCFFHDCSGAVFVQGRSPNITGNTIINCTDAAVALNGITCAGGVVGVNTISNEALAPIPSMIAMEEGASDWTVIGNTLIGANGGGIIATNALVSTIVRGGVIANNVVDGRNTLGTLPVGTTIAALLSISPYYRDWIAHDNILTGLPTGQPNSRLAIVPATGGSFHDNLVDGVDAVDATAIISITPGTGGLSIENNDVRGYPPSNVNIEATYRGICFLFGAGAYDSKPVAFVGGKFTNALTAIDSDTLASGATNFLLHIRDIQFTSTWYVTNSNSAIGDRSDYLNLGASVYPHRIGLFTEMRGTAALTNVGTQPSFSGDKIWMLTPTAGGREGVVKVGPVWKDFGSVAA